MIKTIDEINNIVRTPKHPFRQAEDPPGKVQQRRYERRKVKEYIKPQNWQERDE